MSRCFYRFYIELFVRTLTTSSLRSLFKNPNFTLDILCIAPTFIGQIFYRFYLPKRTDGSHVILNETQFFDYLTCLKIFRLFRLIRHGKSLGTFLKVLYINCKDLLTLTVLILFGTLYFGLTQFVLEQMNEGNEINNMGDALWHVEFLNLSSSSLLIDLFRDLPSSLLLDIQILLSINSYLIH